MTKEELYHAWQDAKHWHEEAKQLARKVRSLELLKAHSQPLILKQHNEIVTLKRQLKRRDNEIARLKA